MNRKLPPLNPLRTFEAAARQGSFTRAAEELRVTQSAVSRQIGLLEEYLGAQLFVRDARGTQLTAVGQQYYAEIGPAFQLLASATQRLPKFASGGPLKIKVYATFAAKWLLRRLPQFQALHPDIAVRISAAVAPVDFARDQVDAAIELGRGTWSGGEATYLFPDEIAPVCAPRLVGALPLPLSPNDLRQFRLLHSHYRRNDWQDWFENLAVSIPPEDDPISFPSSLLTYQAAIDGLGVAIGQLSLLREELATGTLIQPCESVLRRDLAYYLIAPATPRAARSQLAEFRSWLLSQV